MSEFSVFRTVKAKKQHTCVMCGLPIKIGEKYVDLFGVWDSGFFSHKYHTKCKDDLFEVLEEVTE